MTITRVRIYYFNDDHQHREIVDTLLQNVKFLADLCANRLSAILTTEKIRS